MLQVLCNVYKLKGIYGGFVVKMVQSSFSVNTDSYGRLLRKWKSTGGTPVTSPQQHQKDPGTFERLCCACADWGRVEKLYCACAARRWKLFGENYAHFVNMHEGRL